LKPESLQQRRGSVVTNAVGLVPKEKVSNAKWLRGSGRPRPAQRVRLRDSVSVILPQEITARYEFAQSPAEAAETT